jgi:Putative Actinobacterial Holin-X, holin superfamily III
VNGNSDRSRSTTDSSDVLLGQLAHELSLLVRCDVELSRARHAAERSQRLTTITEVLVGGAVGFLALAAASWAIVQLITKEMPEWAASAVLAAVWAIAAVVLLWLGDAPGLIRRFVGNDDPEVVALVEAERESNEAAVRATARLLAAAATRETVASIGDRTVEVVKRQEEAILDEIVRILTAPGRIGMDVLERVAATLTRSG